jgi:hypothetical protein
MYLPDAEEYKNYSFYEDIKNIMNDLISFLSFF